MAWLARNNLTPSDRLYADMLNSLSNDDRVWGGDVNGGGYHLSNVILDSTGGFTETLSPITVTPGTDGQSSLVLTSGTDPTFTNRWTVAKDATPETGGNSGSNFAITRYADDGSVLGTPITINRATGLITMGSQHWTGPIDGGGQTISNVTVTGTITDPTTTKGDLLARSATAIARLAVGANGQVLTADSTQALGVKWAPSAGGGGQVYDEIPAGTMNGANTAFTLAFTPNPAGSVDLYLNGVSQDIGVDYTLSGAAITYAVAPKLSDTMWANYTH